MKQKNNITLLVIGVLTLLVAIVGAAYAYFSSSITPGSGLNLDVEAQANTAQFTASGGQFGFTVTGAEMQQANAGSIAKEATGSINVSLTSPKIAMCTFDVAFAWNSGSSYTATSGRGSQFEFGVLYEGNPYGAINNAIKPINFDMLISGGGKVLEGAKIIISEANGTSKTTNITLNFKVQMYNLNHDQSSLAGSSSKTYSGRFYVTNVDCQENKLYLNDVILASNEIYPDNVASTYVTSSTGINFGNPSSDTNGKGVYYTNQNTENNDYTFYYRGDVQNNYVALGTKTIGRCTINDKQVYDNESKNPIVSQDECIGQVCKFCSIEYDDYGDVILSNCNENFYFTAYSHHGDENCNGLMYGTEEVGNAEFLQEETPILWRIVRINEDGSVRLIHDNNISINEDDDNLINLDSLGYMYDESDLTINTKNSYIKSIVDEYYGENLNSFSNVLADSGFCNDREPGIPENRDPYSSYFFDGNSRFITPQFKCTNSSRDLFTLRGSNKGNKTLDFPIGLITSDEVIYAGRSNSYLQSNIPVNSGGTYWTMTPYGLEYWGYEVLTMYDVQRGDVYSKSISMETSGVRPVINLRSDIKITGGTGTSTNPYVISLD